MQLLPGDVIYFAPVGPQVAMGGQVNNPAIYELKNEATLGDVLSLRVVFLSRLTATRFMSSKSRIGSIAG